MSGYAWVTLATNDSYSLGALVLAHSLRKSNTAHKLAVLITPAVSQPMREQLQTVFDLVKVVDVLDSKDEAHLALMKRPELGITFTKIHCWRLIEFQKCVFLDADTLVVRNCDELFDREEFSAAPDVSWPDCFNSGVFVYSPSLETFNKLLQFAVEKGSFDGGDQGLLNQFFSDWATEDIKKHLPFVYNLTSVAAYSYIPAFKQYGSETRIVHFIGTGKPWLQQLDPVTRTITPTSGSEHLAPLLQQWWDLFCEKVHPNLDKSLENANGMSHLPVDACSNSVAVECSDEPQTPRLLEPCTPYREQNDFRQFNLPYQPFDVKGSSGELLNVEFLVASAVTPTAPEENLEEQQRQSRESNEMEEKNKSGWREDESKDKQYEGCQNEKNTNEIQFEKEEKEITNEEANFESQEVEKEEQKLEEKAAPPQNPFDYHTFFPDETCVNDYLQQNMMLYQPLGSDCHHHHHNNKNCSNNNSNSCNNPANNNNNNNNNSCNSTNNRINNSNNNHKNNDNTHNDSKNNVNEQKRDQYIPSLPRFLTIPEDDRRQSGNQERCFSKEPPFQNKELSVPQPVISQPSHNFEDNVTTSPEEISQRNTGMTFEEKHELHKSKSLPYLAFEDNTTVTTERQSIWKSQPNVNVDPNKKYSMPKLKPLLPKQNSFNKSMPSSIPKVTLYTEFFMSSEYKDPVDLPKDKVGFVESHIVNESHLRRRESDLNVKEKFGPLPYTWEAEKPITPKKKTPLRHLDNDTDIYDLSQCKRQMGNKPKPKNDEGRKENNCVLPALKPLVPLKDNKSTLIKKRKSKELHSSPGDGGRGKRMKRESRGIKELKRESKLLPPLNPPKLDVNKNVNNVDEILKRLFDFSKDYQHYFGEVTTRGNLTSTKLSHDKEKELPSVEESKEKSAPDNPLETTDIRTSLTNGNSHVQKSSINKYSKLGNGKKSIESNTKISELSTDTIERHTVAETNLEKTASSLEKTHTEKSEISKEEPWSEENTEKSLPAEFKQFRNYVRDQTEATQKGLLSIQDMELESSTMATPSQNKDNSSESKTSANGVVNAVSKLTNGSVTKVCETNSESRVDEDVRSQVCANNEKELNGKSRTAVNDSLDSLHMEEGTMLEFTENNTISKQECDSRLSENVKHCEGMSEKSSSNLTPPTTLENSEEANICFKDPSSTSVSTSTSIITTETKSNKSNSIQEGLNNVQTNGALDNNTNVDSESEELRDLENVDDRKEGLASLVKGDVSTIANGDSTGKLSAEVESESTSVCTSVQDVVNKNQVESIIPEVNEETQSSIRLSEFSRTQAEVITPKNGENHSGTVQVAVNKGQIEDTNGENHSNQAVCHKESKSTTDCQKFINIKPKEVLCVPDFDTPRSSRVFPPFTKENLKATTNVKISEVEEEVITKTVRSKLSKIPEALRKSPQSSASSSRKTQPSSPKSTSETQTHSQISKTPSRKPKFSSSNVNTKSPSKLLQNGFNSSEKKTENGNENGKAERLSNRFEILSNDSPCLAFNGNSKRVTKKKQRSSLAKSSLSPSNKATSPHSSINGMASASETTTLEERTSESGIAGAIAQLSLESGSEQNKDSTAASTAHQEYLRRQNWETGNMDYMGRDSFDNIWSKICQTLEGKAPSSEPRSE